MVIKKIKLPGMAQPVDIGTTWANVSDKPDLMTSSEISAAINAAFATNDAMVFKGTIGAGGTVTQLPATHEAGWTYKVITAGSLAGQTCEIGDMIICITDGETAADGDWIVVQTNIDGAVVGPASSTAGHVATFTGTTGKVIQDSGFTIATSVPANAVFTDTTYENKAAADSGTDVSLVTTGDKYNWNNKYAKPSTGIPESDLAQDVKNKLTAADAALPKTGGTMSGAIAMGSNKIMNLADGTVGSDAATVHQLRSFILEATATIATDATSAEINFDFSVYSLINAYATMGDEIVYVDIETDTTTDKIIFSTAQSPASAITCHVLYRQYAQLELNI